ncbi:MAG: leucyl aminopeptidase [Sciscionella sp.]
MPAPKLALSASAPATAATDVLVIGTVQTDGGPRLAPGCAGIDAAFGGALESILVTLGATGKAEETVRTATLGAVPAAVLLAVGLGKQDSSDGSISPEQVRRASGAAARALAGTAKVTNTLSLIDLHAAVEGSALGAYAFTTYKSSAAEGIGRFEFSAPEQGTAKEHRAAIKAAGLIAEAVCTARDFINTPPNDLYPASFAERASTLATGAGLTVQMLEEKALRKGGFGGIIGVGQGSSRPPRLVRLSYRGSKPKASVALVGKGVTFDTGGISLKPPAGMDDMTSDMSGAAAVVAAVVLAAKLRYPLEVTATVPMAENMPSATAYRPGDVLTMHSGKTVEVLNTDAEGRLILADAISLACQDTPDYLIDTATLTGAQVVSLGKFTAGVMGTEQFRDRVTSLGSAVGESSWAMPLPEELREGLDSKVADLTNVSGNRFGGMLVAGLFLREFVAEDVQWAHIDVAGPAYNTAGPHGYTTKGGTGVPVRTIAAVLADIAANG